MKAKLEFNLPQEERKFRRAVDGDKWATAFWDVDETFRRAIRDAQDPQEKEYYTKARSAVLEALETYELNY